MRLPDFWTGLAFAALGAAIALTARGFHVPAGAASPKLLPMLIGCTMAVMGGAIALRGLREAGNLTKPDWLGSPRRMLLIAYPLVAIIAFITFAPTLGAMALAVPLVAINCLIYGLRPLGAIATGLVAGIGISLIFTHLLGVTLPEGLIEGLL